MSKHTKSDRCLMRIQAKTLSVLLKGSNSVHCYIKLGRRSFNVTLRLDRGDSAQICGYPQDISVYDTDLEQFNHDSGTCFNAFETEGLDPKDFGYELYVSREMEQTILNKLYVSLVEQFKDPMFINDCPEIERQAALIKVKTALEEVAS